jgi:hypothetical protein
MVASVCYEPLAETRGGSAQQGASPPDAGYTRHPSRPEERYRDELVRLPAEEDAASALLREVLAGGARRGWKLVSALREPDGEAFLLTWDTSGYFSG